MPVGHRLGGGRSRSPSAHLGTFIVKNRGGLREETTGWEKGGKGGISVN